MTLNYSIHNDSSKLTQQLAGLRYIVDTNSDVINKNPISKEFLGFKIDLVESYIAELEICENLGDQSKSKSAFENAQVILEQIQVLIDQLLDESCEDIWLDFQKELKFTNNIPLPHKYVLRQARDHIALAL